MNEPAQVIPFPLHRVANEPWCSKREIAAHFKVVPRTIDRWVADGMPYLPKPGGKLFRRRECERWLERT